MSHRFFNLGLAPFMGYKWDAAIAPLLRYLGDPTGLLLSIDWGGGEGNPIPLLLRFSTWGEGGIPLTTRAVLGQAEPNPLRGPRIHVSG